MRVLVQWARENPSSWEVVDSCDWSLLPHSAEPAGAKRLSSARGWINAVNVQGALIEADAIAMDDIDGGGVRVWQHWYSSFFRHPSLRVIDFYPLAPDPKFGGAWNTRHVHRLYSDDPVMIQRGAMPYADRREPDARLWRYGVLMEGKRFRAHQEAQGTRGWREWTEGVPGHILDGGVVGGMRRRGLYDVPDGTRTYYANNVTRASSVHNATHELAFGNSPAGLSLLNASVPNSGGELFMFSTDANEPNQSAWPTGNYRHQLDVNTVNSDVTYGLLTTQNGNGHFARVNASLTSGDIETKVQQEAAFTLPGLKLATTGSVSWVAAGSQSDRFEVVIAGDRPSGMGSSSITLELGETDDFADGPWIAAAAGGGNVPLFGTVA